MKKIVSILLATLLVAAFAAPCFAVSNTTPSVVAKDEPTIIPRPGDNEQYIAYVIEDGEVVEGVTKDELDVTPFSQREGSDTDLEEAHRDIQNADSLGDLNKELDDIAKQQDPDCDGHAFIASDIFNVDVPDEMAEIVNEDNGGLRFTIAAGLDDDDATPTYIIRDPETGKWDVIKDVVRNDDGSVTLTIPHTGTIAVLKLDPSRMTTKKDEGNVHTGDGACPLCGFCAQPFGLCIFVWLILALVVTIAVVVVVGKVKKSNN